METGERLPSSRVPIAAGVLAAAGLTLVIGLTAGRLAGFEIVGPTVAFAYPWRLAEPTSAAQLTAWLGYALHNVFVWGVIWLARRERPQFDARFRWFNWALLAGNGAFVLLHVLQTQLFYDGLAQDVPEITALGSVALMLIVILILESPRRGLAFGRRARFDRRFLDIVREYHGYLFSWAIVYTFWYHPTVATTGHLAGFFYMFMLFWQMVLVFNRAHRNRWWTVTLELMVLPHAVLVAINQPASMWRMFGFGFAAIFIVTQMHGLGLSARARGVFAGVFVAGLALAYGWLGEPSTVHEVLRIPVIDYATVGLLYLLFLGGARIFAVGSRA